MPAVIEKQEDGSACDHLCQQPLTWHTGWPAQPVCQPPVCDIIWIWSPCLWRRFSPKRLHFNLKTIKIKENLTTRLHSITLFCGKTSLFDEVVLLSIGKYRQGHLRRDEFRVGSYRKEQRHLSLGSSVTMAWGGGPRSRQPSSVSPVLILRLNTLACSTCFGSPAVLLQIILFLHRDQLLSQGEVPPVLPSVIKINMAAHSEHSRDGFRQHLQSALHVQSHCSCWILWHSEQHVFFWGNKNLS